MHETLDLSAFTKVTHTLKVALDEYQKDTNNEFVRDACIKRFKYSYGLATKMISRHLSVVADNPSDIKEMSFQDKIREAYNRKLVQHSWDTWCVYRDNHNKTSHSYNLNVAMEIMQDLPTFYAELAYLLDALNQKTEPTYGLPDHRHNIKRTDQGD